MTTFRSQLSDASCEGHVPGEWRLVLTSQAPSRSATLCATALVAIHNQFTKPMGDSTGRRAESARDHGRLWYCHARARARLGHDGNIVQCKEVH